MQLLSPTLERPDHLLCPSFVTMNTNPQKMQINYTLSSCFAVQCSALSNMHKVDFCQRGLPFISRVSQTNHSHPVA